MELVLTQTSGKQSIQRICKAIKISGKQTTFLPGAWERKTCSRNQGRREKLRGLEEKHFGPQLRHNFVGI